MGGGGRRRETSGRLLQLPGERDGYWTRAGVAALSAGGPTLGSAGGPTLGSMAQGVTSRMVCCPGRWADPTVLTPGCMRSLSLPVLAQGVCVLSEKNENFRSSHCVPTMCSLSLNAFTPGLVPPDRRGRCSKHPQKGSRNMEEKVRTWEKCLGKWIPWKDPQCQDLSCC